ncbi:DUF1499 domain-containing protein [Pseudalkalibacillus berkeleyi]|uniref:DUF1499 domain-containing protein n=1 Tax=Pseudalkalibacillus berkeleyi TaxID=1069813 RepID=A0ABS9H4T2_9BACL|nr:DUF1499 domain-containing protein [Pseudalkalibacillus berkeleyi]MCF6138975.1 DUF1499 domain-containing protein [Pseudalkalibacillus berkeleyi]
MTNKRQLKECPSSPNCVSSQTEKESHYISPISYNGSSQHALATLVNVLKKMKRTKIVEEEPDYIHVECKSKVFRFTDDVEFLFDTENKVIEVRSASRKGYSDFGVNRKRMEKIRQQFINQL